MVRKKAAPRRRTVRRRASVKTIRGSEIIGAAMLLDGLVGLPNLFRLDLAAMGVKLQASVTDPTAEGGLIDDLINAAAAFGMAAIVEKVIVTVFGRLPGLTFGSRRVAL